jgi:pyruvate,orthophosphate dikinase
MFFGEQRINVFREMILSDSDQERAGALEKLRPMQRDDFYGIFKAMAGKEVTIRLLDAPLHEFLPHNDEEFSQFMSYLEKSRGKKPAKAEIQARLEALAEFNPMLGHRGCRLGITYPEITEMQARAIFEAVVQVAKKGKKVIPEVMIPLIGGVEELSNQKAIVKAVAEEVLGKAGLLGKQKFLIGTMIEIPRAAITAGRVATEAEFFSFGTHDLTQTTMGLSRDDYTKFSKDYEDPKIFKNDPFAVIDREGVGELIKWAVAKGRETRPDLEVGICGEHGGEPNSVEFCYMVGMDYVSCSPYRLPIARLAAAQAAIAKTEGTAEANRTA